jgi:signal transduction histidine kinase
VTRRREIRSLAFVAIVLAAGGVLTLDRAGALELTWDRALVLACVVAGGGLLTVAPPCRAQFAGTLSRLAGESSKALWGLRAITVATAPLAGFGAAAYGLVTFRQVFEEEPATDSQPDGRRSAGTALLCLAFVLMAEQAGLTLGSDNLLWGVLLGAPALTLFWWGDRPEPGHRAGRLLVAGVLVLLWVSVGVVSGEDSHNEIVIAVSAGGIIALLIAGPRWARTSRALAAERVERARATERSEVAGMVHDSVLQTLALIQTRANDPAEVKALARRQERDLRESLFGGEDAGPLSVAGSLRDVAAEVEDAGRVKVDVVIVGDARLDEASSALVASAREALFNAAKHAPGAPISLFAEIGPRRTAVFVRDRGPGFDLEAIPADRRGVRDSIVARMVRQGGHAAVRTAPGGGCEVQLVLERDR